MTFFKTILLLLISMAALAAATPLVCEKGYTCWKDTSSNNLVWVMKNDGNVNGPTCSQTCQNALNVKSSKFYACDPNQTPPTDLEGLKPVASKLGINCKKGGCWNGLSNPGQIWISYKEGGKDRACYPPRSNEKISCHTHPGNANCFNQRYSLVCPCLTKPLTEACLFDGPNYKPNKGTWPKKSDGTSCIDRINYWRKRACAEGWVECPPAGLPPMVECTACHECANSQAEFDKANGAHKSFKRCVGAGAQGEGGGRNCAAVIDAFVSERKPDANGVVRCQGHCGPIVKHGCQHFQWGMDKSTGGRGNFFTLNWRSCNAGLCNGYCKKPSANSCFRTKDSPSPPGPPTPPPPTPPTPPPTPTPPPPGNYLGCFLDKPKRAMNKSVGRSHTVESCRARCIKHKYFAIQDKNYCFCGSDDKYNMYGRVKESQCGKCPGGPFKELKCGGGYRNSVYMVGEMEPTAEHLGCFKDARNRIFSTKLNGKYSVTTCEAHCRKKEGVKFFGVQYRSECWCSKVASYAKHGSKLEKSKCNMPCSENTKQTCGGGWAMNVYKLL